jgi:hypothetical protein
MDRILDDGIVNKSELYLYEGYSTSAADEFLRNADQ